MKQSLLYFTGWRVSVMESWPLASLRSAEQSMKGSSEIVEESSVSNSCHLIEQTETMTTTQKYLRVKNFRDKYHFLTQRKDYMAWNVRLAFHAGVVFLTGEFIFTGALENNLEKICCPTGSFWIMPQSCSKRRWTLQGADCKTTINTPSGNDN